MRSQTYLHSRHHLFRRERGTTLVEALVAMVILSIGLLGMAGLQANSLKLNQTSLQRSQATVLAYTVLDQMRSDTAAAKAGEYDLSAADAPAEGTELEVWRDEIIRTLGAGAAGAICRVATPDDEACSNGASDEFFRVSVQWTEARITSISGDATLAGSEDDEPQILTVVGRL